MSRYPSIAEIESTGTKLTKYQKWVINYFDGGGDPTSPEGQSAWKEHDAKTAAVDEDLIKRSEIFMATDMDERIKKIEDTIHEALASTQTAIDESDKERTRLRHLLQFIADENLNDRKTVPEKFMFGPKLKVSLDSDSMPEKFMFGPKKTAEEAKKI